MIVHDLVGLSDTGTFSLLAWKASTDFPLFINKYINPATNNIARPIITIWIVSSGLPPNTPLKLPKLGSIFEILSVKLDIIYIKQE
jgi:hypothetical protein